MIRITFLLFAGLIVTSCSNGQYTPASVFAHNDYVRPIPFYAAYDLQVGFIEADVFLIDGEILVAHHIREIDKEKTLEALYLKPLLKVINKNRGSVYDDPRRTLTLMVDLKTEGVATLEAVVSQLEKYTELLSCPSLRFMISGNVPDPDRWPEYPSYITFDGRPGIAYTPDQLKRVSMISTSFSQHSKWNGKDKIPDDELKKIGKLMEEVHAKGKQIRFWATPDFDIAWKELMRLKMDVIVTDDVVGLTEFLKLQK
ncbi:MAG: phosphatidylinositol-specific phospholipase C/glycerophosphodiester phosphodiesterase family protein [Cyclobacteriaceae bacterium]